MFFKRKRRKEENLVDEINRVEESDVVNNTNRFEQMVMEKFACDFNYNYHCFNLINISILSLIDLVKERNNLAIDCNIEVLSNIMPKDIFEKVKFIYNYRGSNTILKCDGKPEKYTNEEICVLNEYFDYILEWAKNNNYMTREGE